MLDQVDQLKIVDVIDYMDGQEKYNMKMIHLETLCKLEDTWNALHQTRRCI
jgi:hypothetical protein